MHRCHVKTVSLPILKDLAKVCAVQTSRQDFSEKARESGHADVSAGHLERDFTQERVQRVAVAPHLYRIKLSVRLAGRIKAELIFCRVRDPMNLNPPRFSSPGHKLFFTV